MLFAQLCAVLLSTVALAGKLPYTRFIEAHNGLVERHGHWHPLNVTNDTPGFQINAGPHSKILTLDAWFNSVSIHIESPDGPIEDYVMIKAEEGVDSATGVGNVTARSDGRDYRHVELWTRGGPANITYSGLTLVLDIETEATMVDDLKLEWRNVPWQPEGDTMIHLGPKTAYVELHGYSLHSDTQPVLLSSGKDTQASKIHRAYCPGSEYPKLWVAALDPERLYIMLIPRQVDVVELRCLNSNWNYPCSHSVKPWTCRRVKVRRWVDANWIVGSVLLFLFFLIKGLAWLLLGGGLFVSIKKLWQRLRKPAAEREPLLGSEDSAAQGQSHAQDVV